jgi:serine/threonine protein kinase
VYRISGAAPPRQSIIDVSCRVVDIIPTDGTLRWQAPELMAGQTNLTTEADVYAFAICCIEVLTMGNLPWPSLDDDSVRHIVLSK